ncbi:GNAT family N-acetyltransferase [Catellatospora sichuanensis]|uniref:GNAT family N-acetyltransferase n=1 Tax=Catellatospora sichuanensis TaxID=1969805 RepID=UPI00118209B4|nr:GNAT family N-acetyltransferase [Catellatospora sichuanensis]
MTGPREPLTIDGGTVRLRPWRIRDADQLRAACDDPVTAHFMAAMPAPYTMEHARWWITEGSPENWQTGGASWAVVDPVTDEVLGGAGLSHLLEDRRQAEVGYWVAPWARRRGVATAAARAITDWAFGTLGMIRMELFTVPDNAASQRVALAAGFTREGVRRGASTRRDGSHGDYVAFVRLAGDPPGPVPPGLPELPGGELTDGRVRLRRITTADAEDYFALAELPEVARSNVGGPITLDGVRERCACAEADWLAGTRATCVILDADSGAFAGEIGLYYHERFLQQAILGYALRPEFRGRGFATAAARLLSDWAMEQAGVVRVVAGTFPYNEASRRVLERAGFELEGTLKARLPTRDGTRVDDIQYVRIAEKYR